MRSDVVEVIYIKKNKKGLYWGKQRGQIQEVVKS